MKKLKAIVVALFIAALVLQPAQPAKAQIYEVIKAAIIKIIKAADLQIQRLQNKTIWLQNAQQELENAMSKLKLKEISEWTEKQRKQYDDYFEELWKVKNAISAYRKLKEVVQMQMIIMEEYKRSWNLLKNDQNFTPQELQYMYRVYTAMLEESARNLDQLILIASSFRTQMTDGKRMELISETYDNMERTMIDLRKFNNRNFSISLSRAKDVKQAEAIRRMYGLK